MTSTLLQNGLIVDGANQPAVEADLLLHNGLIHSIAPRGQIDATGLGRLVHHDCSGLVIAPGFIDVHTHDDAAVLNHPDMTPKLSQGVTTVIVGNCGISLVPMLTQHPPAPLSLLGSQQFRYGQMADYVQAVNAAKPGVNVAALVGHTALRLRHMLQLDRPASPEELKLMAADLYQAMQDGALGMSSGVFYQEAYAATPDELKALALVVARAGGVYATHIRNEMADILPALQEAALTAQEAGLPLILSHHKCAGPANWGRTLETLPLIEKLAQGQEIAMDVYPYIAGSTVLRDDLVDGVIDVLITGSQTQPEMAGRYLVDIAKEWGVNQKQACQRLMPGGACYFQMHEDDVQRVIAHPLSMIGSDGLPNDERPHPRLWGTFPRVLACYWRERGVLSLEQAVHKMSGLSARQFRLPKRGLLRAGYAGDVVAFDPKRIQDLATFEVPQQRSAGIVSVWVNGVLSYTEDGGVGAQRAGKFLKRATTREGRDHV